MATPTLEDLKAEKNITLGSAVAVSKDIIITNCHVVEGNRIVVALHGDDAIPLVLISANPSKDACILTPLEGGLKHVYAMKAYKFLRTGERVYAIGSPEGLANTLSEGLISGLRGDEDIHIIQTSAAISHGSSGGGLFDGNGNLIGITTFMHKDGQVLNFAIAMDEFFNE